MSIWEQKFHFLSWKHEIKETMCSQVQMRTCWWMWCAFPQFVIILIDWSQLSDYNLPFAAYSIHHRRYQCVWTNEKKKHKKTIFLFSWNGIFICHFHFMSSIKHQTSVHSHSYGAIRKFEIIPFFTFLWTIEI